MANRAPPSRICRAFRQAALPWRSFRAPGIFQCTQTPLKCGRESPLSLCRHPPMSNTRDLAVPRLHGVIAAIPTPVGSVGPDHARLISLARHLLSSGCDGLNVLGTTGEATSFSVEERMAVMSAVAQAKL